ncbi:UvrD-helicase domain-containing protein [Larkinella sp. VNQ87]|uniref:UvrD-helicase domain-containing protein n=1 Tax=Larkinella sp. VNQ87 TaxID=3400921 RepID=UPI003C10F119
MFKIFSSSAGSGKTYTLTKEYLKLALCDRTELGKAFEAHQFRNILAVTFTNAAARDMKDRILDQLQKIAAGNLNSQLTELARELGIESTELQGRARATFHAILHDYSSFSVLTIDSFVQRVVTAFTDDLELPYSFEVEMDTAVVLQTAIDRLLEKVGQEDHPYLSEALEEFYLENASDGKSWYSLAETLAEFSQGQLGDRNYDFVQKLNELNPEHFRTIRRNLREKNRQIEEQIRQLALEGHQLIQQAGLPDNAFYQGRSGVAVYFRKRATDLNFQDDPNSYVRKAIEEDVWYTGGKKRLPEHDYIDGIKDTLREYIGQIEEIRQQNRQRYQTFGAIEQHLQKVALLKQIQQECDELLREQNRIHISEFNRLIVKVVTSEPVPFIYERLGEKFHHILIDEFQDTSKLQFVNLLPLLDNNLAYQRFNLAVGDAKQAIYRFRGGDMDQIVALHSGKLDPLLAAHDAADMTFERLSGLQSHLQPDRLATNWRSAESIVEFNNSFFHFLAGFYADTEFQKVTEVFDEEFRQNSAKAGIQGHVQLDFIEKPDRFAKPADEDGPDFTTQMVERTLELIQKSVADGYAYSDIAVLCRFKKNARRIADYLEANDIPLTSEDSLTLQSSERVRFLVSLLQLLHQPENRMVRYDMLFLYTRLINPDRPNAELMEFMDEMAKAEDIERIFSLISKIDKAPLDPDLLQQLSLYELAEKLADYFDLYDHERDSAYLFRFMDEVLSYTSRYSSHLSDFLTYWQTAQEKVSVSAPPDQDAVTIQTIHKSKGLEYPVVIIPFADWSFKPRNNETMWADLGSLGELEELTVPGSTRTESRRLQTATITLRKDLDDTPLSAQYRDELYRTFVECMNLVYVAFTRPTDRLYIIAAKQDYSPNKEEGFKNAGGIDFWLYTYLNDLRGNCCWDDEKRSYSLYDYLTKPAGNHETANNSIPFSVFMNNREGSRPLRLRRIERTFDPVVFEKNRAWWQKVCTALTMIQTPDDVEKTVLRLVAEGQLRASEQDALRSALGTLLSHPDLRPLFEPAHRADQNRRILVNKGPDSNPQRSGPNRVVYFPEKIVLVSYLTEAPDESQRAKMQSFLKLYRQMGHSETEGWLVTVPDAGILKIN